MKKSCLVAAFAAGILWMAWAAGPGVSQQPGVAPARPAGTGIALVDVQRIYKEHLRFNAALKQFDGEVRAAQQEWKAAGDALQKEREKLQLSKAGTEDYKRDEESLLNKNMQLQTRVAMQKREFVQREAKLYYNLYQEIRQEVRYICQANNIGVVLNFSSTQISPDKPEDVLRGVNQQVVDYDQRLDITQMVLDRVNPRGGAADSRGNTAPSPFGQNYNR